jgi:methionyl-tRNA formyltransferase
MSHSPFVFFGTPYVARDTLEILKQRGYLPSLVVTSPDSPRGRGLALTPSETKVWALENQLPVITPEKITPDVIAEIHAIQINDTEKSDIKSGDTGASYGIVAAYGKILPKELIDAFPLGIINIHYSLLPKYRGASPVESALLHGETETGVAIQQMVPALDAGDILALEKVQIEPDETTRELRPRLVKIGANLLADILPEFEAGTLSPKPQDPAAATRCKKIKKEDGELHLSEDPETNVLNWNKYRAYAESPGTYFFVQKQNDKRIRIKILTATFKNGRFMPEKIIPEGKSEQLFDAFIKNNPGLI